MLLKYLVPSLLAATAIAIPVADIDEHDEDLVLFKRGHVLEARDLELAEMHGVDLTEMYKQAMIKRDDGDHVIIWVDNNFNETPPDETEDEQGVSKRQSVRLPKDARFNGEKTAISDWCRDHKRQNHAGPNGPYSGGVQAIYKWARGHRGGNWPVPSGKWRDLVVAGSNSGANAVYRAKGLSWPDTTIGTMDVRNDADWTQNRAQKFGNSWRASSKGGETCGVHFRINYQLVKTTSRV